ncbi:hypothetical protein WH95_17265 [Kiloniella litopenaei]|uniref:Lipoprotein n=3 Tax=Kiloniella litopenaei TaxID=1549748 RepID=A0A0M2R6T4_9PROT|nr:hypothetical protein WH95_17265 [Kiloniella litopenaei]
MMKFLNKVVCALSLVMIGFSLSANARPLTGVQDIKLNISPLGHYSKQCGLSREAFERALLGGIPEGDIRLSNSSSYWLHTRVTTVIFDTTNCVSNVEVTLYANTRYFNPATQQELSGRVEVWRAGGLYSSVSESHQVQVNNALRKVGRKLHEAWKKDQY